MEFMVKRIGEKGVAIRFAKKLVNCNALCCCTQKFLNVDKKINGFL